MYIVDITQGMEFKDLFLSALNNFTQLLQRAAFRK